MSLGFSPSLRQARAEATVGRLDAASAPGSIELYATAQPAFGAAAGGSPLAVMTLQKPCGSASGGVIAFAPSLPAQVVTGGTVLWARAKDGDGNWVIDGNVAVTGTPGAGFTLDDVVLYAGAFVFLFGATLTEP